MMRRLIDNLKVKFPFLASFLVTTYNLTEAYKAKIVVLSQGIPVFMFSLLLGTLCLYMLLVVMPTMHMRRRALLKKLSVFVTLGLLFSAVIMVYYASKVREEELEYAVSNLEMKLAIKETLIAMKNSVVWGFGRAKEYFSDFWGWLKSWFNDK